MFTLIIVIHTIVCIFLVLFVLIQSDKGGGLAGALSGMGGVNTVFGGKGTASVLTKATTWLATSFMVVCLLLNVVVAHRSSEQVKSVLQKRAERMEKMAPASALPGKAIDPSTIQPQAPAPAKEQ